MMVERAAVMVLLGEPEQALQLLGLEGGASGVAADDAVRGYILVGGCVNAVGSYILARKAGGRGACACPTPQRTHTQGTNPQRGQPTLRAGGFDTGVAA